MDYKMALRKYRKALHYIDIFLEKEQTYKEKRNHLSKTKSQILTDSYGVPFHQVIKGFMIQGGYTSSRNGQGVNLDMN